MFSVVIFKEGQCYQLSIATLTGANSLFTSHFFFWTIDDLDWVLILLNRERSAVGQLLTYNKWLGHPSVSCSVIFEENSEPSDPKSSNYSDFYGNLEINYWCS